MTQRVSERQLLDEVIKLAQEYPDNVYTRPETGPVPSNLEVELVRRLSSEPPQPACCYDRGNNSHLEECGCIVGIAGRRLGLEFKGISGWITYRNSGLEGLVEKEHRYGAAIAKIQAEQDKGHKWGTCLRVVSIIYPELEPPQDGAQ